MPYFSSPCYPKRKNNGANMLVLSPLDPRHDEPSAGRDDADDDELRLTQALNIHRIRVAADHAELQGALQDLCGVGTQNSLYLEHITWNQS